VTPRLEDALARGLPAFLPEQRWFGGKARAIATCEVEDAASLGDEAAVVVVVRVSYADAPSERYALLVSCRTEPGRLPRVSRLRTGDDAPWVVESATDPTAARVLLRGFASSADLPMRHGGRLRYADASDAARRVVAEDSLRVAPIGAEQSNTSLRVGGALVFKLFRRIEPGENPELEIGRFLTSRTSFRDISALDGSVIYTPRTGEACTLGVLQHWVENDGDGWRYVLARLRASLDAGRPVPDLVSAMTTLGAITARCHAALASDSSTDAFAPEPVSRDDADDWQAQLSARVARLVTLVEARLATWSDEHRDLGASFLARVPSMPTGAVPVSTADLRKIRIHGDYHLGQTLRTRSAFAIIDFEGEPARPIAERRRKHCALKDVAGMLRSFEYAIETACEGQPAAADTLRNALGLRAAFLGGYRAVTTEQGGAWAPAAPRVLDDWLRFFEFDKALRELEYEINNRPAWAHIPLRGILRVLDGSPR
jgi:maltose alpha-D-glucosyltransferase/alpha-amylase